MLRVSYGVAEHLASAKHVQKNYQLKLRNPKIKSLCIATTDTTSNCAGQKLSKQSVNYLSPLVPFELLFLFIAKQKVGWMHNIFGKKEKIDPWH